MIKIEPKTEEKFDIYTKDGRYLGVKSKTECHASNPGFYHKPVWIWAVNDKGEILVQKRSGMKKSNPNKWDMSVAGHTKAGEMPIEAAIRETYEEIGLKFTKDDFEFLFEYVFQEGWELAQVYLLKMNAKINDMILQKEEVSLEKWFSFDEFKKIIYSDEFAPHNMDFRDKIVDVLKNKMNFGTNK